MAFVTAAAALALWGLVFWLPDAVPALVRVAVVLLATLATLVGMPWGALRDTGNG